MDALTSLIIPESRPPLFRVSLFQQLQSLDVLVFSSRADEIGSNGPLLEHSFPGAAIAVCHFRYGAVPSFYRPV